ncbi:MAG: hypothetical protein RLZZ292_4070 [Bacteroidota bacterium]|jgi:hypothetical protein
MPLKLDTPEILVEKLRAEREASLGHNDYSGFLTQNGVKHLAGMLEKLGKAKAVYTFVKGEGTKISGLQNINASIQDYLLEHKHITEIEHAALKSLEYIISPFTRGDIKAIDYGKSRVDGGGSGVDDNLLETKNNSIKQIKEIESYIEVWFSMRDKLYARPRVLLRAMGYGGDMREEWVMGGAKSVLTKIGVNARPKGTRKDALQLACDMIGETAYCLSLYFEQKNKKNKSRGNPSLDYYKNIRVSALEDYTNSLDGEV